jgi:hypothetical protein
MKMKNALLLIWIGLQVSLLAQSSMFTYQGRFSDNGVAANGVYEMRFGIYDAASSGNAIGNALTNSAVTTSNGLFTVQLDFGSGVFDGSARWLGIGVRTGGSTNDFTVLLPRQQITAAPYAMQAASALNATGAITDAQLSANVARVNGNQTFTGGVNFSNASGTFSGNGTLLTNVNASLLNGLDSSVFWKVGGNSGATPGTQFIGTSDNQVLDFRVNNSRGLRIEPTINDNNEEPFRVRTQIL